MLADDALSNKHWGVDLRVNPTANLMLAILTIFWAQMPTPKKGLNPPNLRALVLRKGQFLCCLSVLVDV